MTFLEYIKSVQKENPDADPIDIQDRVLDQMEHWGMRYNDEIPDQHLNTLRKHVV